MFLEQRVLLKIENFKKFLGFNFKKKTLKRLTLLYITITHLLAKIFFLKWVPFPFQDYPILHFSALFFSCRSFQRAYCIIKPQRELKRFEEREFNSVLCVCGMWMAKQAETDVHGMSFSHSHKCQIIP